MGSRVEPIFKSGDYIIDQKGDIGLIDKVTPKNYYKFKAFYGHMFKKLKEKGYELQVNYQKFFRLCTEEEKEKLDEIIKKGGK